MASIEAYKEQGKAAFTAREYKKAAKIYRDALERFGGDAVLYANRAQCFIFLQDWPRALRDADSGLLCVSDPTIRAKLLFRKGIALKQSDLTAAARCFQEVLDLGPNSSAQAELDQVTLQRAKKQRLDREIQPTEQPLEMHHVAHELEVEVVDSLPEEYRMDALPRKTDANSNVDHVAKELFGDKKPAPVSPVPEFAEMPSMYHLRRLRSVPAEKKQSAFSLVLNLDNSVLASLFQSSGVDVDFLEFFLDALLSDLSSGHSAVSHHISKLEYMSTFSRHSLVLSMCDQSLICKVTVAVEECYPDLGTKLRKVLEA